LSLWVGAALAALCGGTYGQSASTTWPVTPEQRDTANQVAQAGVPLSELAPNAPDSHTVVRGDTLWDIAKQFNVTIKQLQDWNSLSSTRIRTGQRLILYLPGQLS